MHEGKCRCDLHWGAFLLRLTMGVLFFFAGLTKFIMGTAGVSKSIIEQFSATWLPASLVAPYAYALPYLEITLGALLILGLFRFYTVAVSGLLMLSLAFGTMLVMSENSASNFVYVALFAAVALTGPFDEWKLDRLVFGSRKSSSPELR